MVAVDYDAGSVSEDDTDYPQVVARNTDKENVINILKKHPAETKKMQMSNDLMSVYDTDLYMDLFDYYSEDMPYDTMKARDGDPVQYISDELDELGLMDEKVVEVDEDLEQSLKKAEADLQSQKNALGDKELETMLKIAGLIKDKLPKKEDKVDEDSEEPMDESINEACSLKCKECGDMLGEPTTDCQHDSQDPKGENWIMVDLDGDGDDDLAVKNEDIDYQSEIDRILGLAGLK
jgi:hypothetical protein